MLKVVVIDDEALVRVGLKSMINWEEMGLEIAGEASNGQQGLDLIMSCQPDIVITDIKMPVMDGLEMMRLAQNANFRPKFIILSSYDEFQLVKQAMKQGAEEYLIKLDLEPEILINTLAPVRDKILAESNPTGVAGQCQKSLRENISMLREGFLKRMIDWPVRDPDGIAGQAAYLGIELNEQTIACALVRINNIAVLDKYNQNDLRVWEVSFLNTINEIANDIFKAYTFTWNQGEFIVIFSGDPELREDLFRNKAINMAERLVQVLRQYFNIPVSIGVSGMHQGYQELAQAYFESYRAAHDCLYSGSQAWLFFGDLPQNNGGRERIDLSKIKSILPKAVELHDLETIRKVFQELIAILNEKEISRGQAFDLCFQIVYLMGEVIDLDEAVIKESIGYNNSLYATILSLNTLPEIVNWLSGLEQGLCRFLSQSEAQKNHRLIIKAKKYIMEHFTEEINLNEVAATLNISPGYLSTIFKQHTGVCFTDYVTENKIEHAKKLLKENAYKIYEISDMLGYQNAYYFSKVFKKVTGMTPSEFLGRQ